MDEILLFLFFFFLISLLIEVLHICPHPPNPILPMGEILRKYNDQVGFTINLKTQISQYEVFIY